MLMLIIFLTRTSSAISALLYLAQYTRLDISFVVNMLARCSSAPMRCHWNGIKDILCYLKGTLDMGLFYPYVALNDLNHISLGMMFALKVMLMLIIFLTRTRQVLRLIMSLPLRI